MSTDERRASPLRVVAVWSLLALAVVCLTVLFACMRAVMDVGGYCASGGPYEIAVECPRGAAWMLPLSLLMGLAAGFGYAIAVEPMPGPNFLYLAWPALFLSLGWNFWEYGLDPPGPGDQIVWGWIVCGVLFVAMGGIPLVALLHSPSVRRSTFWGQPSPGPSTLREAREAARSVDWRSVIADFNAAAEKARQSASTAGGGNAVFDVGVPVRSHDGDDPTADDPTSGDLTDRLERLSALYRRGDLTAEEFAAAKQRLISGEDGR